MGHVGRQEGRKRRTMLFLRQQRINWLQWTGGACGAAERMKAQDNVIPMTAKDQLAAVDLWGACSASMS
ncbi:hypothetical protein E2C01_091745 [Portunus trituberculatus]|uniref:Uncharacterized protein n=1 Tax=Portunus trituberculatus TaxID=210409 RepID=A0A5B7JPX0_PORTR|nr:hypothetical protein [Portunus trituberculatus]